MTKKEKIQACQEAIESRKAWIEKHQIDDEISEELKQQLFAEVEQEIKKFEELKKYFENSTKTKARTEASKRATEARSKRAKEKIQNAINLLRMENKEITAYQISKVSGVHFNTVKKYIQGETL